MSSVALETDIVFSQTINHMHLACACSGVFCGCKMADGDSKGRCQSAGFALLAIEYSFSF